MKFNIPNQDHESGAATSVSPGLRYNEGKLRYDLIHPIANDGLVKVLTIGARKYSDRNWENGMPWSTVIASLKRHLAAIERGEDYDEETGLLHADHLQCNAHFLSAYYKIAPKYDDRRKSYLKSVKIGLDIDGVLADFCLQLHGSIGHDPDREVTHWNDPVVRSGFDKLKNNVVFWSSMPVLTGPDGIPFEPHCYVTARPIDPSVTQAWLYNNGYPSATLVSLGHNESKVETLKKLGVDIYVDDRFENFREINAAGILCYLFDSPHNRKYNVGHKRIKSLKELA